MKKFLFISLIPGFLFAAEVSPIYPAVTVGVPQGNLPVAGKYGVIDDSGIQATNVATKLELSAAVTNLDLSLYSVTNLNDVTDVGSGSIISTNERTKLDGIETGADVTDATNVEAAGALMDGDFVVNGFMERIGVGAYTNFAVTAAGKALMDDASATEQMITLGLGSAATNPVSFFVQSSIVDQPNGVAGLDENGFISTNAIPDITVVFAGGPRT